MPDVRKRGDDPAELPPIPPDPYADLREEDDWEALFDALRQDEERYA